MAAKKSKTKSSQYKKSKPSKKKIDARRRADLEFPVGKIHKKLKSNHKGSQEIVKVEPGASVYLAAVL